MPFQGILDYNGILDRPDQQPVIPVAIYGMRKHRGEKTIASKTGIPAFT